MSGRRAYKITKGEECSRCTTAPMPKGHYCKGCHAAYKRARRQARPISAEAKRKDACRSYAGVYKRRGKLTKQPCEHCNDPNSEMHHADYGQPLKVEWLCRPCHLKHHQDNPPDPFPAPTSIHNVLKRQKFRRKIGIHHAYQIIVEKYLPPHVER